MRKQIFCFLSAFTILHCAMPAQQNLVPNWDMEATDCGQIPVMLQTVDYWFVPAGGGTTDYFNSCYEGLYPGLNTPINGHGHEGPHSGVAYLGFGTWQVDYENSNELMRVQLTEPLEPEVEYEVSCYLSLAEISSVATDQLHFHFTPYDYDIYLNAENDLVDDVQVSMTNLYDVDSVGWYFFQSSFIADGGEEYLTIGDFRYDSEIDTLWLGLTNKWEIIYAYYYIDDVVVKKKDVSVSELSFAEVTCFPNPVSDELFIQLYLNVELLATVYDITGHQVEQVNINARQKQAIYMRRCAAGCYLVHLQSANKTRNMKIVKS